MVVASGIDQDEFVSEDCGQGGRVMAHDRQTAASLRTVRGERPDDDVSAGLESLLKSIDVSRLIGVMGQEVECGAIVPQIVGLCRLPFGDVSDHPLNVSAAVAQTFPRSGKGGSGKIQNGEPAELSADQIVDKT